MIRVLRILEYIGEPEVVYKTLEKNGVQGVKKINGLTIREAIIGNIPEIFEGQPAEIKNPPDTNKEAIAKNFAEAYEAMAHMEYNLAGHMNSDCLVAFRKAIRLAKIDINPYLPTECGKV